MAIDINAIQSPGVYAFVQSGGAINAAIADHAHAYMVGTASTGPVKEPAVISSLEDFQAQFGTDSLSEPYVQLFFRNDPSGRLFFVRAEAVDNAAPTAAELIDAVESSFTEEHPQGYLLCPQGFQYLADQSDRDALVSAMEGVASRNRYMWIALADAAQGSVTTAALETEFANAASGYGHLALFAPWVIDLEDRAIPPSAAVAAVACRRYREQGFYQPPAGPLYSLKGVKGLTKYFSTQEQDILNPQSINLLRRRPAKGVCIWGARVRSNDSAFRFINQRVIFNVIARTLTIAYDSLVFNAIDGEGVLFQRIKGTGIRVMDRFYFAGALYGPTPGQAYQIVCGYDNNSGLDLENGTVRVDVYAIPAPTMERLVALVKRVPIGHFTVNLGA